MKPRPLLLHYTIDKWPTGTWVICMRRLIPLSVCVCVCVCNREAIGSLMAQLQDLRSSCATEEAKVSSLRRELYDTSKELGEALSRNNRQVSSHTPPV